MSLTRIIKENKDLFYIISISIVLGLIANHFIHIYPDIFLILVVFLTIYYPQKISLYTTIVLGSFKDILSVAPLGLHILGFLLCRLVVIQLKKKIYPGKVLIDACLVLICAAILYVYIVLLSKNKDFINLKELLGFIFMAVFFTTLISIPLFLIFKQIKFLKIPHEN